MHRHVRVIVAGAGASGLSAAGALRQRGIEAVLLDQDDAIGGSWARRYDRLHLHTMRRFSGLAHFPIPRRYPQYLARDEFVAYLREYVRHFALDVVTGSRIHGISRSLGDPARWTVSTSAGDWTGDAVVVATGQYIEPVMPAWPGRELYRGSLTHSSVYAEPSPFAGKRVLVVGAGNSGSEIATDIAEHGAASVTVSIRTAPPVIGRDPFGMPLQRTGLLLSFLPAVVADCFARLTSRITIGDLTRYGMPKAQWMPYSAKSVPLIDVGFVRALKRGILRVKPALVSLTAAGGTFADGSSEPYDAIIAATGFATGLHRILDVPGVLDGAGEPVARSGDPTAEPGLFFIGFTHSLRGHIFEANLASRRLAGNVSRYLDSLAGGTQRSHVSAVSSSRP